MMVHWKEEEQSWACARCEISHSVRQPDVCTGVSVCVHSWNLCTSLYFALHVCGKSGLYAGCGFPCNSLLLWLFLSDIHLHHNGLRRIQFIPTSMSETPTHPQPPPSLPKPSICPSVYLLLFCQRLSMFPSAVKVSDSIAPLMNDVLAREDSSNETADAILSNKEGKLSNVVWPWSCDTALTAALVL